jgi:hypothetical protein
MVKIEKEYFGTRLALLLAIPLKNFFLQPAGLPLPAGFSLPGLPGLAFRR